MTMLNAAGRDVAGPDTAGSDLIDLRDSALSESDRRDRGVRDSGLRDGDRRVRGSALSDSGLRDGDRRERGVRGSGLLDGALGDREVLEAAARLEKAPASTIIRWAVETFHPHLCLTASMTDALLIDLAVKVEPAIEVVFIDTGYHFPETLEMVELVRRRYGLNLRVMTALTQEEELWKVDPENCCSAIKTGQLDRALVGKEAWMSGVRRSDAPTRAATPVVHRDLRGLVKINPIATWDAWDVAGYIEDHDVPVHPLVSQGYLSIGCWPCTKPVEDGADPRSGRWPGIDKTECGLHV